MLLALTTLFFALGFSAAIFASKDPAKSRHQLLQFLHYLRSLVVDLKGQGPAFILPVESANDAASSRISSHSKTGSHLLTPEQIEESFDTDTWQRRTYDDFKDKILARGGGKTFPCVYATMGYRAGDHRYVFLDSDDPSEPRNVRTLGPAIHSYLQEARSLGPNTSLVVLCAPSEEEAGIEEYNRRFWGLLRGLRYSDSQEWPNEVPSKTSDEQWTFCFEGEALFPVALTPAHDKRWSRHTSSLTIAMQPKWVLDQLLSTPEKRKSATDKVRKLLRAYDDVDISPDLTQFGVPGTSESRQLCLLDENETSECPYVDFEKGNNSILVAA